MWGQQEIDGLFPLGEAYYGLWRHISTISDGLKLKYLNAGLFSFCLLKTLTDGLEWCGLLWCFYSYSDGTHSLQRIHGEQVKECYISPNLIKKQTLKGNTFSACFHFCRHNSFNIKQRLLVWFMLLLMCQNWFHTKHISLGNFSQCVVPNCLNQIIINSELFVRPFISIPVKTINS